MKHYLIKQTSDTSGDSVDTTTTGVYGFLYAVDVEDGNLSDNFDITLTYVSPRGVTKTLLTLTNLSADATYYPREQVHGNTGAGLDYNDESDEPVETMPIIDGIVTSTLADGGSKHSGSVTLYVV